MRMHTWRWRSRPVRLPHTVGRGSEFFDARPVNYDAVAGDVLPELAAVRQLLYGIGSSDLDYLDAVAGDCLDACAPPLNPGGPLVVVTALGGWLPIGPCLWGRS